MSDEVAEDKPRDEKNEALARDAIGKLRHEQGNGDTEAAHWNADKALCELLIALGFRDVVTEWVKVDKWFA